MAEHTVKYNFVVSNVDVVPQALKAIEEGFTKTEAASIKFSQKVSGTGETAVTALVNTAKAAKEVLHILDEASGKVNDGLFTRGSSTAIQSNASSIQKATNVYKEYVSTLRTVGDSLAELDTKIRNNTSISGASAARLQIAIDATKREVATNQTASDMIAEIRLRQARRIEEIEANHLLKMEGYAQRLAVATATNNRSSLASLPSNIAATTTSTLNNLAGANTTATREIAAIHATEAAYIQAQQNMQTAMNNRLAAEQVAYTHGAQSRQALELRAAHEEARIRSDLARQIASINSTATPNNYAQSQQAIHSATQAATNAIQANREALRQQTATMHEATTGGRSMLEFIAAWGLGWRAVNTVINGVIAAVRSVPAALLEAQATVSALHASMSTTPGTGAPNPMGDELVASSMAMLQREAQRTGISLTTLETNYRSFMASTTMAGESVATSTKIFQDMNSTITALHMSGDKAQSVFLALAQIFNKSKVQSEELTKQLGNLLPGAFAAFAQANHMTTQKLVSDMKSGSVKAHETVEAFTAFYAERYNKSFELAAAGLQASLGRQETAWTNFARSIGYLTNDLMIGFNDLTTSILKAFTPDPARLQQFKMELQSLKGMLGGDATGAGSMRPPSEQYVGSYDKQTQQDKVFAELQKKQQELQILKGEVLQPGQLLQDADFLPNEHKILVAQDAVKALAKQYAQLGIDITNVNEELAKTGTNFDEEIAGDFSKIQKFLYASEMRYAEIYGYLQNVRNKQKDNPNADKEGFVPDGMPGMSKSIYMEAMEKATEQLNKKAAKAAETETKKVVADQQAALADHLNQVREATNNKIDMLRDAADKEKQIAADKIHAIERMERLGQISYAEAYQQKLTSIDTAATKQIQLKKDEIAALRAELAEIPAATTYVQPPTPTVIAKVETTKAEEDLGRFSSAILAASRKFGVDPLLVKAVIKTESVFDPNAVSPAGAKGLMQLMPPTAKQYGAAGAEFDTDKNIMAGTHKLADMLKRYHDVRLALNAYNWGEGNLDKALKKAERLHTALKVPKETAGHAAKILADYEGKGAASGVTTAVSAEYDEATKRAKDYGAQRSKVEGDIAKATMEMENIKRQQYLETEGVMDDALRVAQKYKDQFATPDTEYKKSHEELNSLLQLGVLNMQEYAEALNGVTKKRNEDNQKILEAATANKTYTQAMKQMTRDMLKADKDDKGSYLADLQQQMEDEQRIFNAKQNINGSDALTIEQQKQIALQVQEIADRYDTLQQVIQNASILSTLKDGFKSGLMDIIEGTKSFAETFKNIFDTTVKQILSNSINNLVNGVQRAFSSLMSGGSIDWSSIVSSGIQVGASALMSWFGKSNVAGAPAAAATSKAYGTGAMTIADTSARSLFEKSTLETVRQWNSSIDFISSALKTGAVKVWEMSSFYVDKLSTAFNSSAIGQFLNPLVDGVKSAFSTVTAWGDQIWNGVTSLFTTATSVVKGVGAGANGINAAIGTGAGTAATDVASKTPYVGTALAILKLGYDLFSIAGDDMLTTVEQISHSLWAAGDALFGIALATMNPVIAIAGVVTNTVGSITDMFENGFTRENISRLFLGPLASIFFPPRTPNTWMNTFSNDRGLATTDRRQYAQDQNGMEFWTRESNKGGFVGVHTAFGALELSIHEIKRFNEQELIPSYVPLLQTIRAYDNALGTSINVIDDYYGQTGETLKRFNERLWDGIKGQRIATKQDLSDMSTAAMVSDRFAGIGNILGQVDTVAGRTASTWIRAFSEKLMKPGSDNAEYNQTTTLNIEAFIAANLFDLTQLPLRLADLFVKSVRSVADGATQQEFQSQMTDFFAGWSIAKNGLERMGIDIGATHLEEYLTSLTGLGMSVKDAGISLVRYATVFKEYGANTAEALDGAFTQLVTSLKGKGFSAEQVSGYLTSFTTFGSTAKEAGVQTDFGQLDRLAQHLNSLALEATQAANDIIDHTIAAEGLEKVSRKAAIQQLVLSGKIDETTVANAAFGKSLTEVQKTVFDGINFANDVAARFGATIGAMGVSFSTLTTLGDNINAVFGDASKATAWVDSIAKAAMTPEAYNRMNLETSAARFAGAATAAGVPGLNLVQMGDLVKTPAAWRDLMTMIASTDPVIHQNGLAWVSLANAGLEYKSAVDAMATSSKELTKEVDTSASAITDYIKEYQKLGKSDLQSGIEDVYQWRDGMIASSKDIATSYGVTQEVVLDYIQAIASGRYTAAIQSAIDALKGFRTGIEDWVATTRATKVGTPEEQFASMQTTAIDVYRKALSGDPTAMGKVTSTADSYISSIEARYGSSDYANQLKRQVIDAVSALPEQVTLQDVVQKTSDEQVEAIYSLPASISDAIKGKDLTVIGELPQNQNLLSSITPAGAVAAQPVTPQQTADTLAKLDALVTEVKALRADARHSTEAIIDGNFMANGVAAETFTKSMREQTMRLIYDTEISVGLVS